MYTLLFFALQAISYPPPVLPASVTNPADVRSGLVNLDTSGNGTWDFTVGGTLPAFAAVPDVTHLVKSTDTTNSVICNYTAITTSSVTVHCNKTSLVGLLTGLLGGSTAGLTVNFLARYRAP